MEEVVKHADCQKKRAGWKNAKRVEQVEEAERRSMGYAHTRISTATISKWMNASWRHKYLGCEDQTVLLIPVEASGDLEPCPCMWDDLCYLGLLPRTWLADVPPKPTTSSSLCRSKTSSSPSHSAILMAQDIILGQIHTSFCLFFSPILILNHERIAMHR